MCCAINEAATAESPRKHPWPHLGRDKDAERMRIAEVFIPTLAQILDKYLEHQPSIVKLTRIPLAFDMQVYTDGEEDRNVHLRELLEALGRIVERYADAEILQNVAAIFAYFGKRTRDSSISARERAIFTLVKSERTRIVNAILHQLRSAVKELNESQAQDEQQPLGRGEREARILDNYRRISTFIV